MSNDDFCELLRVAADSLMRAKIDAEMGVDVQPEYADRARLIQHLSAQLESWFQRDRKAGV